MNNMLFITTQYPYPLDNGGKIGAYNGISVVSEEYDVTVISFSEEPRYVEEGIDYYKNLLPSVRFCSPIIHDVHIRKKPFKLFKALGLGYLKKMPYIVSKFIDDDMFKTIDSMFIDDSHWDVVFIDYLNMWSYGEYIVNKYINQINHLILKDHNIEYELVKQEAEKSSFLKKCLLSYEWKRTLKYETQAIKKADLVFSVCQSNTEWMRQYNKNSWTMLPTYTMLDKPKGDCENESILYMGNLSWKSNMDGLKWFVNDVFNKIIEEIPNVRLKIVGSGPSDNPFAGFKNIDYMGYVKDVSNIYDDQSVFIVPLFEGSGIRIKILEAFNNEIAVVSTTLGCETIGAKNGRDILIADDIEAFANAVIYLLRDKELNNKIRVQAKQFLMDNFSLEARQSEFSSIVSAVFEG